MIARFARWYDGHPVAGDACLALALLLGVVLPTELSARGDAAGGVVFSALLLVCVPLRRRAPVPTFVAVCLLCLAQLVVLERMVGGDFVALVALYTIVVYSPGPRLAVAATACMLVGAVLVAARWDTPDGGASVAAVAVSTVGAVALAATLGAWRRSRRAELAALQERNRLLALERDQQAAVGAAIERARIARELHDVIAHSLSVIVVQADGAAAGAEQRPAAAVAALRTIGDTGREALAQMRRLLGVLRDRSEDGAALAPQPGLAQLDALVDQVARAGLPARLVVEGTARPVGATGDVTAYRVAQEALTNVLKHAGTVSRVDVVLRYRADAIELLVRDDKPRAHTAGESPGLGLVGMRERLELQDGTLEAGPDADGGFAVRAVIPHGVSHGAGVTARVFLADDQALVRAGFRMLIEAQPDMEVVGEAYDGRAALEALAVTTADVVLMDVRMPGLDGVQATERLLAGTRPDRPAPKVIMLTTFDLDEYVFAAIRAGASGFLLKGDARPEDLLGAVRAVLSGDAVVAPSATRRLLDHVADSLTVERKEDPRLALLTAREREVLLEVARGRSNAEIAADLFMAEATVKTHVGRLLAKLDQRDRVQLAVLAYETGLVRPTR